MADPDLFNGVGLWTNPASVNINLSMRLASLAHLNGAPRAERHRREGQMAGKRERTSEPALPSC
jgi:hypothetical protein